MRFLNKNNSRSKIESNNSLISSDGSWAMGFASAVEGKGEPKALMNEALDYLLAALNIMTVMTLIESARQPLLFALYPQGKPELFI